MYQPMNVELACKFGMGTPISARCLWDGLDGKTEIEDAEDNAWICAGHKLFSLLIPYLTPHMAKLVPGVP
jgi:hypothetical protein